MTREADHWAAMRAVAYFVIGTAIGAAMVSCVSTTTRESAKWCAEYRFAPNLGRVVCTPKTKGE